MYEPYWIIQMKKISKLFRLQTIAIPAFSVLVADEYVQNEECGWYGSPLLCSHTYSILVSYKRKEMVAFLCGKKFAVRKKLYYTQENKAWSS